MSLSRKNYVALAATLRPLHRDGEVTTDAIRKIAHYLETDNERFDRGRFITAAEAER